MKISSFSQYLAYLVIPVYLFGGINKWDLVHPFAFEVNDTSYGFPQNNDKATLLKNQYIIIGVKALQGLMIVGAAGGLAYFGLAYYGEEMLKSNEKIGPIKICPLGLLFGLGLVGPLPAFSCARTACREISFLKKCS